MKKKLRGPDKISDWPHFAHPWSRVMVSNLVQFKYKNPVRDPELIHPGFFYLPNVSNVKRNKS